MRTAVRRSNRVLQKGIYRDRSRVLLLAERAQHIHVRGIGDRHHPGDRPVLPQRLRETLGKKTGRRIMRLIVEKEPAGGIGQSHMGLRRETSLPGNIRTERVCIKARRDRPGRHDPWHVDACSIERDDAPDRIERHAGALQPIGVGRYQRRKMRSRAVPDQHDPARIDVEPSAMLHQPAQGARDIGELILHLHIRHQAIIKRRIGIAFCYEIAWLRALAILFGTHRPAAAMDEQDEGSRWPFAGPIDIKHLLFGAAIGFGAALHAGRPGLAGAGKQRHQSNQETQIGSPAQDSAHRHGRERQHPIGSARL